METAIGLGLDAVKALVVLIQEVQDIPDLVEDIKNTAHQFRDILDTSSGLFKVRYLNAKERGNVVSSQMICIEQLKAITEILRRYFNAKRSWYSLPTSVKFYFLYKDDLKSHMSKLTDHTKLLGTLINQLRDNSPYRTSSVPIPQTHRPVMNIEQYVLTRTTTPEAPSDK